MSPRSTASSSAVHACSSAGEISRPSTNAETDTSALTRSGVTTATRSATAAPKELPTSAADSMPSASIVCATWTHSATSPLGIGASPKPGRSTARTRKPAAASGSRWSAHMRRSATPACSSTIAGPLPRSSCGSRALLDKRDDLLGDRLDDFALLFLETGLVATADDPERAGADVGIGANRQAANLVPAEPLDLERVHRNRDGRERAVAIVDIDRTADRLEISGFGAHE